MSEEEAATLVGAIGQVLSVPLQVPMKRTRSGDASGRSVALVWLAFLPVIALYEALAVPLVVGAVAATLAVVAPSYVISLGLAAWSRLRSRAVSDVRTHAGSTVEGGRVHSSSARTDRITASAG